MATYYLGLFPSSGGEAREWSGYGSFLSIPTSCERHKFLCERKSDASCGR